MKTKTVNKLLEKNAEAIPLEPRTIYDSACVGIYKKRLQYNFNLLVEQIATAFAVDEFPKDDEYQLAWSFVVNITLRDLDKIKSEYKPVFVDL